MNKSLILKTVCAVGLSAACVWGLAACSTSNTEQGGDSGAVAATVNGKDISEDTVTKYIERLRSQMAVTDEDSWGKWLSENGYTPESVREQIANSFIERELIIEGADEKGISVETGEIDEVVNKTKENYDSDEKWQAALESSGMTEDEYRSEIEYQIKYSKFKETFNSDEDPSNEDMLQYAQMYASAYDGAKRSSHILFESDDEATAQEVLDKINSGELDFAEAAKEYSKDSSASNGGDIGWDKTSSLVTEYQTALDGLEKDQVSDLVTSQYGIHIIKCTDVFKAPEKVENLDQIPAEWVDTIKEQLKSQKQSEAFQQWLEDAKENADITINPMPEGLSYIVDMSKYPAPEGSDESGDGSDASDGADNGDAAEGGENADASDNAEGASDNGEDANAAEGGDGNADANAGDSADGADNADDAGAADGSSDGSGDQASGQPAEAK